MSGESLMGGDVGGQSQSTDTGQGLSTDSTANTESTGVQTGGEGGTNEGTNNVPNTDIPEWLTKIEGMDEEYSGDTSLKAVPDVQTLVKNYVHAQRKMGKNRDVVPDSNSTNEEWLAHYHKLGLPTEYGEYSLERAEDTLVDDEFYDGFKEEAFKNNMLPGQAQAMLNYLQGHTREKYDSINAQTTEASETAINGLREEWGDAFDQNVYKAKAAVAEFGGDQLKTYLNESGLGNDPQLIKAFAKIGETFLKEDNFKGEGKPAYAMSPSEASQKASDMMANFDGAYHNSSHPDHKRQVDEMSKLYEIMGAGKEA